MKKLNQADKNKILYNLCMILCIQLCLSVFSAVMEFGFWDGLLKNSDCGLGFLVFGIPLLSVPVTPIVLFIAASKYSVKSNTVRYTLLSALPIPIAALLVGCYFIRSPDIRLQTAYYFLNPLIHSYEYILEMCTYFTDSTPSQPLQVPALCLAQLTEAVTLMFGMRTNSKP